MTKNTSTVLIYLALHLFNIGKAEPDSKPSCTTIEHISTTSTTSPIYTSTNTVYTALCSQSVCQACPACSYPLDHVSVDDIVNESPIFGQMGERTSTSDLFNSQCLTYTRVSNDTYLVTIVTAMKDNSTTVDLELISNGSQGPGSYRLVGLINSLGESSASLTYGYILKTFCPSFSKVYAGVTNTALTECDQGNETVIFTPIYGFSPIPRPDRSCLSKVRIFLETTFNIPTFQLPNKGRITCVAEFNGQPVINFNAIISNPDVQAVSYPSMLPILK